MFYGVFESFSWIDKVSFQREPPLILLTGEYIYELTKKKKRYRPEVIFNFSHLFLLGQSIDY